MLSSKSLHIYYKSSFLCWRFQYIDWSVPFSADIDWSVLFSADIDWSVLFSADIDWSVPFSADIDWSVLFSADIQTHVKFLSCTLNCGLLQMIHQPTRGLNCLDLVLVSVPSLICNLCVVEPIAVSCDHSTVDFSILFSYMPTQPRLSYPDFAKADYVSITAYLDSIDWLLLQSNCSQVEDFWSEISNIMMM